MGWVIGVSSQTCPKTLRRHGVIGPEFPVSNFMCPFIESNRIEVRIWNVKGLMWRYSHYPRFSVTAALIIALVTLATLATTLWRESGSRHRRQLQLVPSQPSLTYANLSVCKYERNGELNCPDARRTGQTTQRQFELVLSRMLRVFDLIATKHSIKYWLYKGTLLGAVRNSGHNVFDNDLDIAILREDYEKFIREGAKDLPEDVFLQTEQSDPHWRVVSYSNMLAKLRDRHSCYTYCSGYGCEYHNGLMIDLFVIDSDTNGFLLETYTSRNVFIRFLFGPKRTPKEDVFPLTKTLFDGYYFPVPARWDRVLIERYGSNYMEEPESQEFGFKLSQPICPL